jgi:hypothetical protein
MNTTVLLLGLTATLGVFQLGVLAVAVALAGRVIFRPDGRPTPGCAPTQCTPQPEPRWAR